MTAKGEASGDGVDADRRAMIVGAIGAATAVGITGAASQAQTLSAADNRTQRIVALEEHYALPSLSGRIPADRIIARGFPPPERNPVLTGPAASALADLGDGRITAMDAAGITVQVLGWAGPGADLLSGASATDFAREANDAVAAAVRNHPKRFAGFAHLPMGEPAAAAAELQRCVESLGFKGAMVNGITDGRFLDHPSFAPLLARAERLNVPLYLHPNVPPPAVFQAYYSGLDPAFGERLAGAGFGWHAETGIHILRLVMSGTLERYRGLKLVIGHAGEFLPMTLDRTDGIVAEDFRKRRWRSLAEQLRQQVWLTTSGQFTAPVFQIMVDTFGIDRVLFSVDYPFSRNDEARSFLDKLPLQPREREQISHGNADALLKLA